jgi:hypothetical protein
MKPGTQVHQKHPREQHMRYMTMIKSVENSPAGAPPLELMQAIAKLGEEATKAGVMVQNGGLGPSATGARVRISGGKLSVTDGPFAESKEIVGGFAVYDVKSKEEVVEWTKRFMQLHIDHWKGWEGEAEVRPIFGG